MPRASGLPVKILTGERSRSAESYRFSFPDLGTMRLGTRMRSGREAEGTDLKRSIKSLEKGYEDCQDTYRSGPAPDRSPLHRRTPVQTAIEANGQGQCHVCEDTAR